MTSPDFADIERAVRDAVESQGFMKHMGAKVDELTPGRAVFSLERRDEMLQQNGFFHGGTTAFLIDVGTTTAAATLVDRSTQSCLTAEYKLNLVAPARGDKLTCESTVVKPGRRMTVVEAKVFSHQDNEAKLVAIALATIAIIDRLPTMS